MRDLKSQRDSIMWKLYQFCSIITIQIFSSFDLTTSSYKSHGDGHFSWLGTVRSDSDNKPDMGGLLWEMTCREYYTKKTSIWDSRCRSVTARSTGEWTCEPEMGALLTMKYYSLLHYTSMSCFCCLPLYPWYPPPYMAARKARILLLYLRHYSGIWHRSSSDIFVNWIKND